MDNDGCWWFVIISVESWWLLCCTIVGNDLWCLGVDNWPFDDAIGQWPTAVTTLSSDSKRGRERTCRWCWCLQRLLEHCSMMLIRRAHDVSNHSMSICWTLLTNGWTMDDNGLLYAMIIGTVPRWHLASLTMPQPLEAATHDALHQQHFMLQSWKKKTENKAMTISNKFWWL